jgi:hypothetical protein
LFKWIKRKRIERERDREREREREIEKLFCEVDKRVKVLV